MDVQPINQAPLIAGGMALVPDYLTQQAQQQQLELQRQAALLQQQLTGAKLASDARAAQRGQAFDTAMQAYVALPPDKQPQALINLMAQFPEQSEGLKRTFEAQDETKRRADLGNLATIYGFAQSKDYGGAATALERRIAAETADGGQADPNDQRVLAMLKSGDATQQQNAVAMIGMALATAVGPDKFAEAYGRLNPSDKATTLQREYEFIKNTEGPEAAQQYLENHYDPLVTVPLPGGRTFNGPRSELAGLGLGTAAPSIPAQGGGDQSTGGRRLPDGVKPVQNAAQIIRALFPQARITSTRRDPNSALGRANPNSFHNSTDAAVDIAPIKGMTFDQYIARLRAAGHIIIEQRDEAKHPLPHTTGPNWHVVLGMVVGVPRVTTKQQYDALPSGTEFIDPKGVHRRKS